MIIIGDGKGWDLEAMAGKSGIPRKSTKMVFLMLTVLWTLLLITVSGLVQFRWFLVVIGGVGMLQNIYAAGTKRSSRAFNVSMKPYNDCPTIIGHREARSGKYKDSPDSDEEEPPPPQKWEKDKTYPGVMGALMAIENLLPYKGVGATLATEFFPGGLTYHPERYRFKRERKYWKMAFHRMRQPQSTLPLVQTALSTSSASHPPPTTPTAAAQSSTVSIASTSSVEPSRPSSSSTVAVSQRASEIHDASSSTATPS